MGIMGWLIPAVVAFLSVWAEPTPRNLVVCAESLPARDAVAAWAVVLWQPGERTFWLGCINPDLTLVYTTPEETAVHCGGNNIGCLHFGTMIAYGTTTEVLAHEMGHAFGLTHTNTDGLCTPSIMTDVGCPMYITQADRDKVIELIQR